MLRDVLDIYIERASFFLTLSIEHLQISAIAIVLATTIGLFLGIIMSQHKRFVTPILGITSFIYTIPAIALLGFLIPFSGIGNGTAIIALTIYALLPMVRNTYTGITNIDKDILEAAKGMGSTNLQILLKIKLPLALPVIISGFRNMVVMTIALTGIASFIGAGGLGVAIYRGITTNNTAMTVAGSLAVAILALSLDYICSKFEKAISTRKQINIIPIALSFILLLLLVTTTFSTNSNNNTIKIATKPMTEQFIISEILALLIEANTDLNVEITKGIGGGTSNIHPALIKGEFDLYPEYTGTAWSFVLKETTIPDSNTLYKKLVEDYNTNYNLDWKGLYGFNNTYGIAVSKATAQKYNLKTYSDLARVSSQLSYGAEADFFEREDGYNALSLAYGFEFKKTTDMDIGLKYKALENNDIDAMIVFTTDGQLSNSNIVVLEDDKNFFENYYCGTVIRMDTLEKYPELEDVLLLMDNLITNETMSLLNYEVETNGKTERDVAKLFLEEQKLLEVRNEYD